MTFLHCAGWVEDKATANFRPISGTFASHSRNAADLALENRRNLNLLKTRGLGRNLNQWHVDCIRSCIKQINLMKHLPLLYIVFALGLLSVLARGAEWQTDYDKALATAKAENKRVFVSFTGSDWCGPCIAMHDRVFSKQEFLDYAKKNLVLVEVDYPKKKSLPEAVKQQNARLKQQFGIDKKGFPTIALVDPSGKILGDSTGYSDEGPTEIIARIEGWAKQ